MIGKRVELGAWTFGETGWAEESKPPNCLRCGAAIKTWQAHCSHGYVGDMWLLCGAYRTKRNGKRAYVCPNCVDEVLDGLLLKC